MAIRSCTAHFGRENDALVRQTELLGAPGAAERHSATALRVTSCASALAARGVFVHQPRQQVASRLPQFTPMRTGFHSGTLSSFRNCGSRLLPRADVTGLMRYLASAQRSPGARRSSLWP